jgi:Asp/Glu/hydantoin racemase
MSRMGYLADRMRPEKYFPAGCVAAPARSAILTAVPRLLLINPNVSDDVTRLMADEARHAASAGTEIVTATARFGALYIENRVEAAIAGHAVMDALAEHAAGCDAAIVAAFGDPGLAAAKELVDIPVLGISEAAMLIAWTLGRRYSIVCLTRRLRTWYMECAVQHGLDGRLASVRALDVPITDITKVRDELAERLVAECLRAVDEDDAEVVIPGGGPIAGLARRVADRIPVPTVDGVSAAVRLAEAVVGLAPRPPERGSFTRPRAKPTRGLAPALGRAFDGPSPPA